MFFQKTLKLQWLPLGGREGKTTSLGSCGASCVLMAQSCAFGVQLSIVDFLFREKFYLHNQPHLVRWFQLIWKICLSNGIISPKVWKWKIFELPPPSHVFVKFGRLIKPATYELRLRKGCRFGPESSRHTLIKNQYLDPAWYHLWRIVFENVSIGDKSAILFSDAKKKSSREKNAFLHLKPITSSSKFVHQDHLMICFEV